MKSDDTLIIFENNYIIYTDCIENNFYIYKKNIIYQNERLNFYNLSICSKLNMDIKLGLIEKKSKKFNYHLDEIEIYINGLEKYIGNPEIIKMDNIDYNQVLIIGGIISVGILGYYLSLNGCHKKQHHNSDF